MTAVDLAADQISMLPVGQIRQHPKNRDPGDVTDLVESVIKLGVLEPLLVRALGDDEWELIAGGRRRLAAEQAGLMFVPCIIRDDLDERARVEARAVENLARKDYHPLDEAAVYEELVALGATQNEIAELIGYPKDSKAGQPYVSDRLKLLRLPEEAATAFRAGHLTVKQAETIASLSDAPETLAKAVTLVVGTLDGTVDDWQVRQLAEEARVEKTRTATIAELTAAGVRIATAEEIEEHYEEVVDNSGWFALSPDGIDADVYEIGVAVADHITEPCAAALIGWRGEAEHFCTDPNRHRPSGDSAVKALNLTDDPEVAAQNPDAVDAPVDAAAAERDAKWKAEEAKRRKEREAEQRQRAARFEVIGRAISSNRSKSLALDDLVAAIVSDDIVDTLDTDLREMLGLDKAATRSERGDALREYVAAGGDNVVRFALAVAAAIGETALDYATNLTQYSYRPDRARAAAKVHLDRLVALGYTPTAEEADAVVAPGEKVDKVKARHLTGEKVCASCGTDECATWFTLHVRNGKAVSGRLKDGDEPFPLCGDCNCGCGQRRPSHADCLTKGSGWTAQRHAAPDAEPTAGDAPVGDAPVGDGGTGDHQPIGDPVEKAYKLTKPRMEALRVLAFADATGAPGAKRTTFSTPTFEGADVELGVLSQSAGWLITEGLALADGALVRITLEGRRVALEEELLNADDLPALTALPATEVVEPTVDAPDVDSGLCPASGRHYAGIAATARGVPCPKCATPIETDAAGIVHDHDPPAVETASDAVVGDALTEAWAEYTDAKAAAAGKTASGAAGERFATAKESVLAALVDRHPDVFALTAGVAANLDGLRNGGAQFDDVIGDIVVLLEQGGPLPIEPANLAQLARLGDELMLEPVPAKKAARRIYVDELLKACESRP